MNGIVGRQAFLFAIALCACDAPRPVEEPVQTQTEPAASTRCDRAGLKTASIALLDALRTELPTLPHAERAPRIDRFLQEVQAQGGTPLVAASGDRVAFLHRDVPAVGYSVAGSFNAWNPTALRMTALEGTDLHVAETSIRRTGAHAYKLVDGEHWFQDPRAHNVEWDGLDRKGPGEFNALVFPSLQTANKGRLLAFRQMESAILKDARDVFVYVPAKYDTQECPALPSMVFHDGNEALTRSPFQQAADSTYAANPNASALLVFVALPSQDKRMCEYTFGNACARGNDYLRFIRDDLIPFIKARFRVCASAQDTGISGASLGGLISGDAGVEMPQVFGYIGSQSGSYFWQTNALIEHARQSPLQPVRWYVDSGCPDDNCAVNDALADVLQTKGYALRRIREEGGQHDWAFWQKRLPGLLTFFREGRSPNCH